MVTGKAAASRSGLYADPREDWLALRQEEIIDPRRPIVDPHHHLWDRGGQRYLIEEMTDDIASGHNVVATVYVDCRSMYRAAGRKPSAGGRSRIRQWRRGDERERRLWQGGGLRRHRQPRQSVARRGARPVLEAEIAAGNGRFRGIRHSSAWDADADVAGMYATRPKGLLLDPFRQGFACLHRSA